MKRSIFIVLTVCLLALAGLVALYAVTATPTTAGNPETTWTDVCLTEVTSNFSSQFVTKFECSDWNFERFCDGKAIIAPWPYDADKIPSASGISGFLDRLRPSAAGGVYIQCFGS